MRATLHAVLALLLAPSTVFAQDWQYDESVGATYDCDVIEAIAAEYGDLDFMKLDDGGYAKFGPILRSIFVVCPFWDEDETAPVASAENVESVAELDSQAEDVAQLKDNELYAIDGPDCNVVTLERSDTDLGVSFAGAWQDRVSVDIYLPGESRAIALPNVHDYELEANDITFPVYTAWADPGDYPLGRYYFDLHIDDVTYRFGWLRQDAAINTITVTCVELALHGLTDAELTTRLKDGDAYELAGGACLIATAKLTEDMLSVLVTAEDLDNSKVQVTYPGMRNPIQMTHVDELLSPEGEPLRVEGIFAEEHPLGAYLITVSVHEQAYHLLWDREEHAYKTIILNCDRTEAE